LICREGNIGRGQALLQPIPRRVFNAEYILGQLYGSAVE
jgi:hypothetical protein